MLIELVVTMAWKEGKNWLEAYVSLLISILIFAERNQKKMDMVFLQPVTIACLVYGSTKS